MAHILGIDISKAKLDAALRRPDGKWRSKVVENTPAGFGVLGEWLVSHGVDSVHACIEATGTYYVVSQLARRHATVGMSFSKVMNGSSGAPKSGRRCHTCRCRCDARPAAFSHTPRAGYCYRLWACYPGGWGFSIWPIVC